jgi:hypothetical protein
MLYNKEWERPSNPVSDVLLKAAELIAQKGHAKYTRLDYSTGSMCLLGAIDAAQGNNPDRSTQDTPLTMKATLAIAKTLGLHLNPFEDARYPAVRWNNDGKRTAQEVIDTLRLAAEVVRQETMETQNAV